jgi:hypothetical protein
MAGKGARWVGGVVVLGALLGLIFAAYSTSDYAAHLDRQIHQIHCSFIPGAAADSAEANPCKTALFSPYSAIFRQSYWGGIPISTFALGTFGFFVGFGAFVALAGARAPRRALQFLGTVGFLPFLASLVMFTISATQLHAFCKVCVGVYASSTLVAISGAVAWWTLRREKDAAHAPTQPSETASQPIAMPMPRPVGSMGVAITWLAALGASALLPPLVYVSSLPDYKPLMTSCGKLTLPTEPHNALIKVPTTHPIKPVTLFEDPLCPTCKAFHERMVTEGAFENLDVTLSLFPLDNECNWMLDRPLHPGACVLSKAIVCGKDKSRAMLEWSYAEQDDLREAGKSGTKQLREKIAQKWGKDIEACIDDVQTTAKLNQQLHYAANNHVPVSTPQMFLGETRLCDEDTDLGLPYTLAQLAPEALK